MTGRPRHLPDCFNHFHWYRLTDSRHLVTGRPSRLWRCPACAAWRTSQLVARLDELAPSDHLYVAWKVTPGELQTIQRQARRVGADRLVLTRTVDSWGTVESAVVTTHPRLSPRKHLFRLLPRRTVITLLHSFCRPRPDLPVMSRAQFLGGWRPRRPQPDEKITMVFLGEVSPQHSTSVMHALAIGQYEQLDIEEAIELSNLLTGQIPDTLLVGRSP